ncbi:MAG: MBOAT family protein, partial [Elusimicrobia bacterium]|nr:MBOAT family protein [Elusimicrobiota bacterium]
MLFNSFRFLLFLPLVFILYWGVLRARRARLLLLLLASYAFYMSWKPKFLLLLLASTTLDYFTVKGMWRTKSQGLRRLLLAASVGFNLGILALFKYADFFLGNATALAQWLGLHWTAPHLGLILPLGISFYTFETVSYAIDGYYRSNQPAARMTDYGLFISFFPHLIAGPIVRPRQFLPQLETPKTLRAENVSVGMTLFLYGLVKKVVFADRLAACADAVFAHPRHYGTCGVWIGVLAYALQIYCDFSGYSVMAIGLARLFGFELPVNFRAPYLSESIQEFWRRWHVTLSFWFRDYLYIPLARWVDRPSGVYASLFATMALCGLWHGANWTFVIWGAYHGLLLMAHRFWRKSLKRWRRSLPVPPALLRRAAARLAVFWLVCVGWVFFRAQGLGAAWRMLTRMFIPHAGAAAEGAALVAAVGVAVLAL